MATRKRMTKRESNAVLQSLLGGVVPTHGLEHIAVGRERELESLTRDLDTIAEGGASFRVLMGRYGSGKTFLGQMLRERALQRNFVVMQADLGQSARFTGSAGQGQMLYRSLLASASTKNHAGGNALPLLLERWLSDIQNQVEREDGIGHLEAGFQTAVATRIQDALGHMEDLVHGFAFSYAVVAYQTGHHSGDDARQEAALRWLRGEYSSKIEARQALGVRDIIDGNYWYDYIRLLASFVKQIGYRGLILFIDELDHLFKIQNRLARDNNYERLLHLYNDTTQGHASHLGIILGATSQVVEDKRRGMFSNEALRTRLQPSRFVSDGLRDLSGPLIRLEPLRQDEVLTLLGNLQEIHARHHGWTPGLDGTQRGRFHATLLRQPGAETLLTPREIVRDFLTVLNLLRQYPERSLDDILGSEDFQSSPLQPGPLAALAGESSNGSVVSPFADFEL